MATTVDGRTSTRWTLALPDAETWAVLADWIGLHVGGSSVVLPQTITCEQERVSIALMVDPGGGCAPFQTAANTQLVEDPPVPVTCAHRWLAEVGSSPAARSCLECGLGQVVGWLDR